VKAAEHLLLRRRLQVDQHVPAADEVDARERRVLDDVVVREHHRLAQLGHDLVVFAVRDEEAGQPLGRDLGDRLFVVQRARRDPERAVVHVGREDLERSAALRRKLIEQDRERVDLFAGRAACDPHPERHVLRPSREQRRQYLALEQIERLFVAEEPRHADQEIAVQDVELFVLALEPRDVVIDVGDVRQLQPALDPASDRARLVVREVDAELLFEHLVDGGHARQDFAVGVIRLAAAQRVSDDHLGHGLRGQHVIGDTGIARGLRHAVELGGLDVLHHDQAAGLVHRPDAARAVRAATRQHDCDRMGAAVLGERAEEDIDRQGHLLLAPAFAQEQLAARDDHLLLGRDQINVVRLDGHPVLAEMDRQRRTAGQDLVHQTLEVGREVLNDHERHAGVDRHVLEEPLERLEAPSRRADADDE
jgi:hypothetical protein